MRTTGATNQGGCALQRTVRQFSAFLQRSIRVIEPNGFNSLDIGTEMPETPGSLFAAMRSLFGGGPSASQGNASAALDDVLAAQFSGPLAQAAAKPGRDPAHRLGRLSERYESGGHGPGTVSNGLRDPGGVSYGLYQLASRTGTVREFVSREGARWAADFASKKPGSPAFTAAWQGVAARDGAAFGAAQHAFIERTHYRPAVAGVMRQTGLDLDGRADAVRDACWSVSVQHGGAVTILCRAVRSADSVQPRSDPRYDRALIEAIYVARADHVRKVASGAAPGDRQTLLSVVAKRYPAELAAALAMLPAEG
jgi:hypothetical protein